MFNKEIPISKTDLGYLSGVPDMPLSSKNTFDASKIPVHYDSSPPGGC